MSIEFCSRCATEFEATSEEVASYQCPNCWKPKTKIKILDKIGNLSLTKGIRSEDAYLPTTKQTSTNHKKD